MPLRDLIIERPIPELYAWAILGPRYLLCGTAMTRKQAVADLVRDFGRPWAELKRSYRPVKVRIQVIPS